MDIIDPYSLDPVVENEAEDTEELVEPQQYVGGENIRPDIATEPGHIWCQCGNCAAMDSDIECFCCRELKNCSNQIPDCLTQHEDFSSLFLTPCVLRHYWLTVYETRGYGQAVIWNHRQDAMAS